MPYFFGAALFFLLTLREVLFESGIMIDHWPYVMTWGSWLLNFAWVVRGAGVSWYFFRGKHIEFKDESIFPAGLAMAFLSVICLIIFVYDPYDLLRNLNYVIYGIWFKALGGGLFETFGMGQ